MLVENKIQIEAIKTRNYLVGKHEKTVMITDGHMMVYMSEEDCLIDISKLKQFGEKGIEKYSREKLKEKLVKINLSKKGFFFDRRAVRLYENDSGDRIWLDTKYIKMFDGCDTYSVDTGDVCKLIVFTRYGEIVGLVLPVRVGDSEW